MRPEDRKSHTMALSIADTIACLIESMSVLYESIGPSQSGHGKGTVHPDVREWVGF